MDQRYYANNVGRFSTPDPSMLGGDLANPSTWNKYAYVNDDPVNYSDPTGMQSEGPIEGFCNLFGMGAPLWFCTDISSGAPWFAGTPVSKKNYRAQLLPALLDAAVSAAEDRLRSHPNCAGLFAGSMFATDPATTLANAMDNGQIKIFPFGDINYGVLAQTTGFNGTIQIAANRGFFTGQILVPVSMGLTSSPGNSSNGVPINGYQAVPLSSYPGFEGLNLAEDQQVILLHELLHFMAVVGDDNAGQTINLPNGETVVGSSGVTQAGRNDCF